MVKVFPFRGTVYNRKKIKKLSLVMAPPYDVISGEEQEELYQQHDFNVVRLIFGKEFPGDNEYNNCYVRAAAFLNGWLRHNILLQEDKPAFYIYEQKFVCRGRRFSRLGFIGLLRLEDAGHGKVFPHEETHSRAKLDRLQLLRATNANLDSVFALYSDEKEKITRTLRLFMKNKPYMEAEDKSGTIHRVWRIDRKPTLSKIMHEIRDKAIFIADGHHRYEAAMRYRTELKEKNTKFTEDEAYNHVMVCFTPLEDKGLIILPYHRVIGSFVYFDPAHFEQSLAQYFDLTPYPATHKTAARVRKKLLKDLATAGQTKHAFGLYLGNYHYFLLTLRDDKITEEMTAEEKPEAWKNLDVTILHYVVLDRILNIAQETEDKVTYTKSEDEAVELVDKKGHQIAFLLNPTKIEEVAAIASELEKLPQKSTYFHPKLLSGLVMYRFDPAERVK
ncbi:DUF1015 domain-containing protein [Candidatus Saganbacteria bacterium]|uniref:DUF1015 domain-containing protein n=1 Tax=Candidatus Saganbacteria bacterium TaxID=2575572 RepID=A0A9D6UM75_UNCSA|nr:DUF1015 domain-containing protein [Candidatus Saganbacteria bacterium]